MSVFLSSRYDGPFRFDEDLLRARGERLLSFLRPAAGELSILLVGDTEMRQMNRRYRGKDKATNVLAFAMREAGQGQQTLLGDVVLSVDTAYREARRQGSTLHYRLTELLIHGLFHLIGHDHERGEKEAAVMEKAERQALCRLLKEERRNTMPHLAINVDHVATIRQARGIDEPDPVTAAGICELAGAAGIVVHLREDRRHIQDRDVNLLRQTVKTKLNLEMGASKEIIAIALDVDPDMVTLVPEKRKELTTEGGLNVAGQKKRLREVIAQFTDVAIPVSLFIDPDSRQIEASKEIGATFVEIHTGRYCDAMTEIDRKREFELVARAAEEAHEAGLRVNAGHGLNYQNTAPIAVLAAIEELSIGHAVMARAIFVGLDRAVREMLAICEKAVWKTGKEGLWH